MAAPSKEAMCSYLKENGIEFNSDITYADLVELYKNTKATPDAPDAPKGMVCADKDKKITCVTKCRFRGRVWQENESTTVNAGETYPRHFE